MLPASEAISRASLPFESLSPMSGTRKSSIALTRSMPAFPGMDAALIRAVVPFSSRASQSAPSSIRVDTMPSDSGPGTPHASIRGVRPCQSLASTSAPMDTRVSKVIPLTDLPSEVWPSLSFPARKHSAGPSSSPTGRSGPPWASTTILNMERRLPESLALLPVPTVEERALRRWYRAVRPLLPSA